MASELKPTGMNPELRAALDRAKHHKMTPEELFEQKVSFVYGQQDHDSPNPRTKDEIRQMLIEVQGRPPCNHPDPTPLVEALREARGLLTRYRVETPLGHQPHMIAHKADEALDRIDDALTTWETANG